MKTNFKFLIIMALFLSADISYGASLRHHQDDTKKSAPTKEDHASYFSKGKVTENSAKEKLADKIRVKTIKSIKKLIRRKLKKERKFELYLRLGEIYAERHDYLRGVEIDEYEKAHNAWQRKNRKGKEPRLYHKKSRAELLKSANAFRLLSRQFPKNRRTDAVLYALANTLSRLNNDNAVLYFKKLIKRYPKSTLIPDTQLALGEFYFDKHQVDLAMKHYKSAMKYKKSRVYIYAIYKLGWSYYNLKSKSESETKKNIKKSIAAFKLVVKLSESSDRSSFDLRQEAIKDLTMVWADTGGSKKAEDYFMDNGEESAFYNVLERMGNLYKERGDNRKAISTYLRLVDESPERKNNPEVYSKVVELQNKVGFLSGVTKNLERMTDLYVKSSTWTKENSTDQTIVNEAKDKTEHLLQRFGKMFHKRGHKSKRKEYLIAASEIYLLYLDTFPENKNAYETRFLLADIFFNIQKFDRAADEYLDVANRQPKTGKFLKQASMLAVVSIKKLDAKTKYEKLPPLGQVIKPIPLPRVKKRLVEVVDNYVLLLPKEKKGFPMRYSAAQIFFDYGHYNQAISRFENIAKQIPSTKQGKSSVKVVLGLFSEQKNWDELILRSRSYLQSKKLMVGGLKKIVEDRLKYGIYQKALQLEKDKKYRESSELFLAFQREFPNDDSSDRSLYNALLNHYRVAEVDHALNAGQRLLEFYPNSKLVPDVMLDMAHTNESLARFDLAAKYYRKYARKYPKSNKASMALYNAATLYKGLKNYGTSIDLYNLYVTRYPRAKYRQQAYWEIPNVKVKQSDYKGAIKSFHLYNRVVGSKNPERFWLAKANIANLELKYYSKKNGLAQMSSLRTQLNRKGAAPALEARRIIARALFNDLDISFTRFKDASFKSARRLESDVKKQQKTLKWLAGRYEKVMEIGCGEYIVASLFRLGELHENFADDLFNAPPPRGASQVEVDQFRTSVEKVAFPLKEEAFKYYESAYLQSREVQTFTEWTRKSYLKMAEIAPERHPSVLEKSAMPEYMGHRMFWEEPVAALTN